MVAAMSADFGSITSQGDFRDDAVAASRELLKNHRGDPFAAGVSYCIVAQEGNGAEQFASVRRAGKIALVFGVCGFIAGGVIAVIAKSGGFKTDRQEWTMLGVALTCTFTGFAALFAIVRRVRKVVRECVTERLGAVPEKALRVNIENASTYNQAKVVPDDAGLVLLHPESRCLQIEGVTHRYLIHAADVADITMASGSESRSVRVVYRIGETQLGITIVPDAIGKQVWSGLTGSMGTFFDAVKQCIG
jgi:hypothetical protein